jgi:hypothetical protein
VRVATLSGSQVEVTNRRGDQVRSPLLTITLAVVSSTQCAMTHIARISDIASDLKSCGKTFNRSIAVKERRQ